MANENEEYEVPSAPRKREIELSRGVVLMPPERMKKIEEEAKEEEKEIAQKKAEAKAPPKEEKKPIPLRPSSGGGLGSSTASVLAVLAIIIALAAIGFSYLTLTSYNQMRTELRGIVEDLKVYKDTGIPISATLTAEHVVQEDIALKDILSPASFPVSKVLEVSGSLSVYNPGIRTYEAAPFTGNLTVTGTIDIDPSILDPSRKMRLNYTIPGKGDMIINLPAGALWTPDLENVIDRLEKISR